MKILQINKFFYPKGGAETYLFALVDLLQKNGHEISAFSQKNDGNMKIKGTEFFLPEIKLDKFYLKNIFKIGRIFWSLTARKNIAALIKQKKFDLVHIHNIYHQLSPSFLPILKKAGLPIVMTVHDFKLINPFYTLWAVKNHRLTKNIPAKILMWAEYFFHKSIGVYQKNIDLFIAPSAFVKNELIKSGFDSNKIIVLPHFVESETGLLLRQLADRNDDNSQEKNYIVSFGRLDASKGFDLLLEALAQIKSDVNLKIIGSGPQAQTLAEKARDLKISHRVEFLSQCDKMQLEKIIAPSLFAVFPSLVHETFGLGVIESYLLGKPVVASRVGAFTEIVSQETGLLFEPGSVNDLQRALETLIANRDLRTTMGQNAQVLAKQKFSSQKHLAEITGLYQSLIDSAKTRKI